MDLSGLRALVTGANGNVGSVVTARLTRGGCQVRGMVRGADRSPAGETVRADLGDRAALSDAARGADLCVNCAAEFSGDAAACRRSNIDGVANLVDALLATGCGLLVHISTISAYDDAAGPDYDEDSPLWTGEGDHPYGPSKAESERIIAAAAARGLAAVILRPALITSMHPRSRWGPQAIEKAAASPDSILPFPEIPHVHVDNLAQAVVLAATTPGSGAGVQRRRPCRAGQRIPGRRLCSGREGGARDPTGGTGAALQGAADSRRAGLRADRPLAGFSGGNP